MMQSHLSLNFFLLFLVISPIAIAISQVFHFGANTKIIAKTQILILKFDFITNRKQVYTTVIINTKT